MGEIGRHDEEGDLTKGPSGFECHVESRAVGGAVTLQVCDLRGSRKPKGGVECW